MFDCIYNRDIIVHEMILVPLLFLFTVSPLFSQKPLQVDYWLHPFLWQWIGYTLLAGSPPIVEKVNDQGMVKISFFYELY